MLSEPGAAELAGPWSHRYLAANGARFHVVETTGETGRSAAPPAAGAQAARAQAAGARPAPPVVVLLHGFPEFWWAWRHQLPVLAAAGYRAVAMDLRGYGASDKTPRGYDPLTLAADVAGVIRGLGVRTAFVVGQGWGGYIGWAVTAGHPDCVRGLCAVSAPHPVELLRPPLRLLSRTPATHIAAMQMPWLPERRIMRGDYVARHLAAWAAPGSGFPDPDVVDRYRAALALWPSPHCALEYHRWLFRSRLRADGRAFTRSMRHSIDVPVQQVYGERDPAVSVAAIMGSARHVTGRHTRSPIPAAGHFPHEEAPDQFTTALLAWLSQCTATGVDPVV